MTSIRTSFIPLTLVLSLVTASADTITWDGGGDGTRWFDPLNWDTDNLPGATDDVVIPDLPGEVTILHDVAGDNNLLSLNCQENLNVALGTLRMTAGASTVTGTLQLADNTTLRIEGAATTFTASGPATIDDANLRAAAGGALTLSLLSSYTRNARGDRNLTSVGTGSSISLPALATITGSTGHFDDTFIDASGGVVDLPLLTTVPAGGVTFRSNGVDSLIDLPALASLNGSLDFKDSGLRATGGGEVNCPVLTSVTTGNVQLDAESTLDTGQFITLSGVGMDLSGAAPAFTNLTTFTGSSLTLAAVAPSFPVLESVDDSSFLFSGGMTLSLRPSLPQLEAEVFPATRRLLR